MLYGPEQDGPQFDPRVYSRIEILREPAFCFQEGRYS